MHRQTVTLVVVLFILIVVGMLSFAYLRGTEIENEQQAREPQSDSTSEPGTPEERYAYIDTIAATHTYEGGAHIIAGELTLPSACHILTVDPIVAESYPEQVTLRFAIEAGDADLCAQVLTPKQFTVRVDVSPEATFSATLMGRPISLELTDLSSQTTTTP